MVDTSALGEERSRFLAEQLNPILHDLVTDLITSQPAEPLSFIASWLQNRNGGRPSDFVIDESKLKTIVRSDKLEALANENKRLRAELDQLGAKLKEQTDFIDNTKNITSNSSGNSKVKKKKVETKTSGGGDDGADAAASGKKDGGNDDENDEEEEEEEDDDDDVVDEMPPPPVNKGPRTSVSAEAYGSWNKKTDFTPPFYAKTEDQIARISATLNKSFLFQNCDESAQKALIGAMQEVTGVAGEKMIKQGDDGDFLFVIESGALECYKLFPGETEEKMVKLVESGDVFGELALLYNTTRAASVVVSKDCVLWKLDRNTFNHIVKDASAARREKFDKVLKEVSLLASMHSYERSQLGDALKEEKVSKGDTIITQGEEGHKFYIIEQGSASAWVKTDSEGEKQVLSYKPLDYFGELALLYNQPRAATVRAEEDCKLYYLTRESFNKMLGPLAEIMARKTARYTTVPGAHGLPKLPIDIENEDDE